MFITTNEKYQGGFVIQSYKGKISLVAARQGKDKTYLKFGAISGIHQCPYNDGVFGHLGSGVVRHGAAGVLYLPLHEGEAMTCKCGCGHPVSYPQKYYATPECRIKENARRTLAAYEHVKGEGWQYRRRTPEEIAANPKRHNRKLRDPQTKGRPVKEPFELFIMQKCSNCRKSFPIPPDEKRTTHYCPKCKGNWGSLAYA